MSEEKKTDSSLPVQAGQQTADGSNKYAVVGASAFIFNSREELLLTRSPQWDNLWVIPGGKVEFGESLESALKREVKEETNLDIKNIKYLKTIELNKPKERPNLHLIVNEFIAEVEDEKVIKLNDEHSAYDWRQPQDWLKDKDVYPSVRQAIEYYINDYSKNENADNKYKRALADYQNLLKQTVKEKEDFAKFANENLLYEILPVYDHLKLVLEHANGTLNDAKALKEGFGHIIKQFKQTLEKLGVEEIKTNGKKFDHNLMEAVDEELTDDAGFDHLVAKEIKGGYMLNGKVILAARVVVYKLK